MRMWKTGLAMVAAWTLAVAAAGDDVAAVQKAVKEAYGKLKSCRAKITGEQNMQAPGFSMKGTTTGTYEFARHDGKYYARTETKDSNETDAGGQVNKTEGTTLMVADGEHVWTLSDQNGVKNATKSKLPEQIDQDPLAQFAESYNLKLLPEETANGAACWVLEATPKDPAMAMYSAKIVQYIAKDSGMTVKTISYMPDGKPAYTMNVTDLEINPDLSPDRFKFTAPEGVTVQEIAMPSPDAEATEAATEEKP